MAKLISATTLIAKHVKRADRVLLVNPPVYETRYSWLKWNQPLDLLKIGAHLRASKGCDVQLLDLMRPDREGHVPMGSLPRNQRHRTVGGERYPMRCYGQTCETLASVAPPTQVWITSLCSYWHESVAETCRIARQSFPDAKVVILGNYGRLMPEHAAERCAAHFVVNKSLDLAHVPGAFDLYGSTLPPFVAVELVPQVAIAEIRYAVGRGVFDVAFFTDDVCQDQGEPVREIVAKTQGLHRHLKFHVICGLHPDRLTKSVATLMASKSFAEMHFEETDLRGGALNRAAYEQACAYLHEAGLESPTDRLSGFVWIGRPGDDLEELIAKTLFVLESCGSVILKPFTPTPGSAEHKAHAKYLDRIPHHEWSPHFFPFAELNKINREEYHDLYRLAAFLNEKVRSRSFDLLNGSLGADMLRESLRREVWKLEPSPLRVADQPAPV